MRQEPRAALGRSQHARTAAGGRASPAPTNHLSVELLREELARAQAETANLNNIAADNEEDREIAEIERDRLSAKLSDHRRTTADWTFGDGLLHVFVRFDGPGAPKPLVSGIPGRHHTAEFYLRLAHAAAAEAERLTTASAA